MKATRTRWEDSRKWGALLGWVAILLAGSIYWFWSWTKDQARSMQRVSTEGKRSPAKLLVVMWDWCNRLGNWEAWPVSSTHCKLSSSESRYWIWDLHLEVYWWVISTTPLWEQEKQDVEEVDWWYTQWQQWSQPILHRTLKLGWPFRDVSNWGKGIGPLDLNQPVVGCRLSMGMRE